jgi:hypothetical protein
MHEHADRLAGCRSTSSSGDLSPLATVIAFPPTLRRHRASEARPNRLSAWVFRLLDAACDGTVRAVLQPSITWADLIATARTDPRIAIAAADPNLDAAIARALAILTRLGSRPPVDVEATLTPDLITFGLRRILAEPVMTPEVADNRTATLQSSGSSEWRLHATDHRPRHPALASRRRELAPLQRDAAVTLPGRTHRGGRSRGGILGGPDHLARLSGLTLQKIGHLLSARWSIHRRLQCPYA